MSKPIPPRRPVKDQDTEIALDDIRKAHAEVARDPLMERRTFTVSLVNATTKKINHGLGRRFENYILSAPKGPVATGRIQELTPDDDTKQIWLQANGFGATVTVRLTVF